MSPFTDTRSITKYNLVIINKIHFKKWILIRSKNKPCLFEWNKLWKINLFFIMIKNMNFLLEFVFQYPNCSFSNCIKLVILLISKAISHKVAISESGVIESIRKHKRVYKMFISIRNWMSIEIFYGQLNNATLHIQSIDLRILINRK